jgi:hypothetical protein
MFYIVHYFDDSYPSFMVNTVDDALVIIGGLVGCNWARSLDTIAYSDGSIGVESIKTGKLLGFTIIPTVH